MTERVIYIRRCTVHINSPFERACAHKPDSHGASRASTSSEMGKLKIFRTLHHLVTSCWTNPNAGSLRCRRRAAPRDSSKFLTSESKLRHGDGREDFVMRTSASSYINDPFGHSSKEVLYKTLHLFASTARLPTAWKIWEVVSCIYLFIVVNYWSQ